MCLRVPGMVVLRTKPTTPRYLTAPEIAAGTRLQRRRQLLRRRLPLLRGGERHDDVGRHPREALGDELAERASPRTRANGSGRSCHQVSPTEGERGQGREPDGDRARRTIVGTQSSVGKGRARC